MRAYGVKLQRIIAIFGVDNLLHLMASPRKRAHTPPTGRTPQKPKPKKAGISLSAREASGRKKLTYGRPRRSLHVPANIWAEEEDKALTQFVLLSCVCDSWPSEKSTKLWEGASKFLLDICKTFRTSKYI